MNKEMEFLEVPQLYCSLDPTDYQYFNQLLHHRTVVFNTTVDEDIVERVIVPLLEFEKDDSNEPVTLLISSLGGSVIAGLSVCNIIDNYKKPLNIIVLNYAFSMGTILMCAGAHNPNVTRSAYPFSTFLVHDGSYALVEAPTGSQKDTVAYFEMLDDNVKEYMIKNTNITRELIDSWERKEVYLSAQQAKEYGLIDKIIGVDD